MKLRHAIAITLACLAVAPLSAAAQQHAALSEAEVDKLRDTQDPADRIKVYLDFMQARLITFDDYRNRPVDPQYLTGKFLDEVLQQYIELDDELKGWIQYQYNRDGDMRSGLRDLLDRGPRQLQWLEHARDNPDPYTAKYSDRLADAIADVQDTLNGATVAFQGQVKKLGELKQQQRESKKVSDAEVKAEKKRIKQEEKLRKKEEKEQKAQENSNSGNN